MQLKVYQLAALDRLRAYLERARLTGAADAYRHVIDGDEAASRYAGTYTPLAGLESVPYCCIRIPTGGGKTLLGAHAVKLAGSYVERELPLVLWLAPSTIIADQTRTALNDPAHPYRQALDDAFGGRVRVFDIGDRRLIRPHDLSDAVCIVVGTHQAFNVRMTGNRNVYGDDEAFEPHFRHVPPNAPGLEINTTGPRAGHVKLSFANLLHLWRPVLILDEAHNFVSELASDVKQRLNPACVIEFTATPKANSNTIFAVSARALADAEMIKLPIMLSEHSSWEAAVAGAVAQRHALAASAAADPGPYLRPIVLFQAQPATADAVATVEKLRAHLIENERVAPERIAVATGNVRDLEGIDLKDPACPVEYVITVAALKEGWDCSFAYVFCSLANLRSDTAVEQLLGRVLRQPDAKRRANPDLNKAYAHVSSRSFAEAAAALKDKLVKIGFDVPGEAATMIVEQAAMPLAGGAVHLEPEPFALVLDALPDLTSLPIEAQRAAHLEVRDDGEIWLTIAADTTPAAATIIAAAVERASKGGAVVAQAIVDGQARNAARAAPAGRGVIFAPIPKLMARVQGEIVFPAADDLIDLSDWRLDATPARLETGEFDFDETARVFRFDLEGEQLEYRFDAAGPELALDYAASWDASALARWIDRTVNHWHTTPPAFLEWVRRLVADLIERRAFSLATLVRGRYALRGRVEAKVRASRAVAAIRGRELLFDLPGVAIVEPGHTFSFDPANNPAMGATYVGAWRPAKHYYARLGALNGEEVECAQAIDALPGVKHWVRNGVGDPRYSFALPTATDLFYPDFVAELDDGRLFIVEYKGADRIDNGDTLEKDNIGRRWAEGSNGRVRFVTACKSAGRPSLRQQLIGALG